MFRPVAILHDQGRMASCMRSIHLATSISCMRDYRDRHTRVSFVPTMGALHDGHLHLVQRAKATGMKVVVSIFVNPTQFSIGEDLDKYPRQLEADLAKLQPLGVDCVFIPSQMDMYPGDSLCHVEPSKFSGISEGIARPDFFRGVATVVCKLFNIVQPSQAFFGQKDISQCILVRRMVQDLNMPVQVQVCPTIRELSGLAMSSRNAYLSASERSAASVLFRALHGAKLHCEKEGPQRTVSREDIIVIAESILLSEPLVTRIEYISVASHEDMAEVLRYDGTAGGVIISAAVRIGTVRLIDNVLVGECSKHILG
jgi:pantoate--beta-alanine ligase